MVLTYDLVRDRRQARNVSHPRLAPILHQVVKSSDCRERRDPDHRIESDLPELRAKGIEVLRPLVFILTDGIPVDDPDGSWETDLDELVDRTWKPYPNLIAYGFGDASELVLRRMRPKAAFVAEKGHANSAALGEAMSSLLYSMVLSAKTQNLQVPENVAGYRTIDLDVVEF